MSNSNYQCWYRKRVIIIVNSTKSQRYSKTNRLTNKVNVEQELPLYYVETTSAECMICAGGGVKLSPHWHWSVISPANIFPSTSPSTGLLKVVERGGVCKQVYNMFPTDSPLTHRADQPLLNWHTIYVGSCPVLLLQSQIRLTTSRTFNKKNMKRGRI